MKMSRAKSRQNIEICGDCSASDPTWASINKGILLCTQCCSVHRSLGRHISQVKSLQKSTWNPNQLNMLYTLNSNGANNIWEHLLLENNSKLLKKKPNPKDPISVKQEFIKSKHLQCLYTFRENYEDGLLSVENELGKQLHASVRTSNLETSFRLLAVGADPNYFHDEKGSTPLHVAVKSDQKLQIELLLIYGADPTCPDNQGKTPLQYAKQYNNVELINRLAECQYEVTDSFSYYLVLNKPNHSNGVHLIIPSAGFKSNPTSSIKLQKLPNNIFEELVMDVYDEVDRRQTEASNVIHLRDLSEVDDDPLYDSVAEDEDYAIPSEKESASSNKDSIISINSINKTNQVLEQLTKQLRNSDNTITDLRAEVIQLKRTVKTLQNENYELKNRLSQKIVLVNGENNNGYNSLDYIRENVDTDSSPHSLPNGRTEDEFDTKIITRKPQRPNSMFETREGLNAATTQNWQFRKIQLKQTSENRNTSPALYSSPHDRENILQCTEQITRTIQQLCKSLQEPEREECVPCGEKVKLAIVKLAATLSKESEGERTKLMLEVANKLQPECQNLQTSRLKNDAKAVDVHFGNIRDLAFNLAKFTKDIVTKYSVNP